MSVCDRRGPLQRAGTSQPDRDIAERRADHFRLDERDTADLIMFARRYAEEIRYHPVPGGPPAPTQDWVAFFGSDISAILAGLAKLPVDALRSAAAQAQAFIENDPARPVAELSAQFKLVLSLPLLLVADLTRRMTPLADDDPLWAELTGILERSVAPHLMTLAQYHRGAVDAGLIDAFAPLAADYNSAQAAGPGPLLPDTVARLFLGSAAFPAVTFGPRAAASLAPDGWAALYAAAPSDGAPFADGATPYAQIYDALNYNLLVAASERIFQALERARRASEARLDASLTAFAAHTPHYGLFLAFLAMFDRARAALDDITGRHMDFYYEDVLRLAPRPAEPDRVHLLAEIARGRPAHRIAAGTGLRAGKDALGREVTYAVEEDTVITPAQVAELRAVRVETDSIAGASHVTVRAAPVADSTDGLGAALPDEAPHFAPFGPASAPYARVGFAVADRQLFLREGVRLIELRTETTAFATRDPLPGLRVRLTGEEGWLELTTGAGVFAALRGGVLMIDIHLDGTHPAILPHDADLHAGPYGPGLPVAEILLDWDAPSGPNSAARAMAILRDATRGPVTVRTEASGLRQLSVRGDDGAADPESVFAPFGATPRAGAHLILGCPEAFARPLDKITLSVTWAERYIQGRWFHAAPAGDWRVRFDFLSGGTWSAGTSAERALQLDGTGARAIAVKGVDAAPQNAVLMAPAPFDATATTGFLRLTLNRGFGHDTFADAKTLALIALAAGGDKDDDAGVGEIDSFQSNDGLTAPDIARDPGGLPLPPYTPEIAALSLSYAAKTAPVAHSWAIAPFGVVPADGPGRLLPDLPFEGALYVGLSDLAPAQSLTLLAQVAPGTGDPLLALPALDHAWLGAQGWQAFTGQQVVDRTGSFAGSGLLSYAIPQAARNDAPHMPTGLHWLRIAAPTEAQAINRLHAVAAQGLTARFVDRDNDAAFGTEPLPAGTIRKLVIPDPGVRGVVQPYPSFGGRRAEDREAFRCRVSERLRHKDRAVTTWDHEHIALEAVPRLYRTKCLPHTQLVREGGRVVADNELRPGHVTLVAVPFTNGDDLRDPLRPYTDRATLARLSDTLVPRASPFVSYATANPRFEEIHVTMNVAFRPGISDPDLFRAEIERAVIAYLTPWQDRGASAIAFGGQVYKSSIIDVVEKLAFVDFLQDVRMFHRPDPEAPVPNLDLEVVRATTARSVLVSARSHAIGLV